MKKKIASLFVGALAALVMMMPVCAEETPTEAVEDVTAEIVTETTEEATEAAETATEEAATEAVTESATEEATEEATVVEDSSDEWEAFKAKITDTATWTMIGASLMTILTTVGTVKLNFDKIFSLVGKKADDETLRGALKDAEKELKEIYNEKHDEIAKVLQRYEDALKNFEENEQKLYAILTLFMTNCKISESAKAEILNILADVKKYDGSVGEVVAKAQEAIDEAVKASEEDTPPTPTLDQMLEEDYMELG